MTLPQVWALVAVVIPMFVVAGALNAVDLAYQLRAGDLMLRSRSLLRVDVLSFTAAGKPWLNQQWGAQILLSAMFKGLGWAGLALLHGLLVGLVFFFVYSSCRARGAAARIAAWVALAAFAVAFENLSLRPQLMGMALFTLTLWLGMTRERHPGRLFVIPLVVAVWANIHGSFFLGPLVVGLLWLEDLHARSPLAGRTVLVALASGVATLLNPFGPRVWSYVLDLSTNPAITGHVSEWQPPTIRGLGGVLFFLSIGAVALLLARRQVHLTWPTIIWLGTFVAIGLTAYRSTAWWALAAPPIVSSLPRARPAPRKELPPSTLNTSIALLLLFPLVALFPWSLVGRPVDSPGQHVSDAPPGITRELKRVLTPGDRMFNAQIWGSWFELVLPRNKVFVDSRIELYPDSIWNQYYSVSAGRQGWQSILDRWRVHIVVISPGQQEALLPFIRRDSGWRLVFEDDDGLIFLRR